MLENLLGETGMAIATFVLIMACVFWAFAPFAVFRLSRQMSKIATEMTALVDEIAALRETIDGRRPSNLSKGGEPSAPPPPSEPPRRQEPMFGRSEPSSTGGLRANRD